MYIGFLWPGDSVWLHALIYPEATKVAKQAGIIYGLTTHPGVASSKDTPLLLPRLRVFDQTALKQLLPQ